MGIAEFSHVSCEIWEKSIRESGFENAMDISDIPLPRRSTAGSAGYDFTCPVRIELAAGESVTVPTGIRCKMCIGYVLMIFPRSSLGFKYGMHLANSVGIIDSDYYSSANLGHIMIRVTAGSVPLSIGKGDRFCQGIFLPYGLTTGDDISEKRTGGFGSTGK